MESSQGRIIGEKFLTLRERLEKSLHELSEVASDAGAREDHAAMMQSLIKGMDEPFVFVVVGEVNVGKSTLLNALFGTDFSRTGIIPTTDKIYFFKYGAKVKHVPITRTLEEVFVPIDFLKNFHVVDTPGTNSVESEHQEITERFVPASDLVIFVFSAINPWGASTWQFLERVYKQHLRNVMFVLGQCDLRTADEVASILEYMRQLCRQRFGREFPVFPVSAKSAYLSRSSGLDRDRLYLSSGFPQLEAHISKVIGGNQQRTSKMGQALRVAGELLQDLQTTASTRVASREEKTRVLTAIEAQLATIEERSHAKLSGAVDATVSDFGKLAAETSTTLHRLLSLPGALGNTLWEKRSVAGLEARILEQVRQPSLERWNQASKIIEDDVNAAADHLSGQFGEGMKVQVREELRPDTSFWEAHRHRLRQHLEDTLKQTVHQVSVEREASAGISRSRKLALGAVLLLLAGCIAGGILYTQGQPLWAGVAAGGGALGAAVLAFLCHSGLRRTRTAALERLEAAAPKLHAALAGDFREDVRELYAKMAVILQPTREKLNEQQKRHTYLQEQLTGLQQNFRVMEAELAAQTAQAEAR